MKPTFIGIGAQKCASTWLHRVLAEHPDVGVSAQKEVDFFSYRYDHGYEWYERQFNDCGTKSVVGEISPSYFCGLGVPERVRRYSPEAKILVSFRDPVQRALSNHRHEVRLGHFTGHGLSFEAGLNNNPMYVEQGRYATHFKRWLEQFPKEQILVVLMEDVESDPVSVVRKVYSFLGVDASYEPQTVSRQFNRSYANRSQMLLRAKDNLYRTTRRRGLEWVWNLVSLLGLKSVYRNLNTVPSEVAIPAPKAETVVALRNDFASEIRELSALIERPLTAWLK